MTLLENILFYGSIYAVLFIVIFLAFMRGLSPRVWGFSDYPKEVTSIVEPQTASERRTAMYLSLPVFSFMFGFPIVSTLLLETTYVGGIPFLDAFLNLFGVAMFGNLADLLILDLLIVGTITPDWVIIPGTEHLRDTAYKDFRLMHAKSHIRGTIGIVILCAILALVIVLV